MSHLSLPPPGRRADVRPGAMTTTMIAARDQVEDARPWLRYAVVVDHRIVVDRAVAPGQTLTVGPGADADIVETSVPRRRALLRFVDGSWCLVLFAGARARVGEEEIIAETEREVTLASDGRARIELGENTILVQLGERPPRRERAPLPAALMGGLLEGADYWFSAFVVASFMLHFVVVAFLAEADWPVDRALIPERVVGAIFIDEPVPEPRDIPEVPMHDGDEPQETVADAEPGEESLRPRPGRRDAPARPRLTEAEMHAAADAVHQLLGPALANEGGAFVDLLRDGAAPASQGSLLADVGNPGLAMAGDTIPAERDHRRTEGEGCTGRLGAVCGRERGGRAVGEGGRLEEFDVVTVVRPIFDDPIDAPTAFDPAELHRQMRRRIPRIRACYERIITASDPTLGGRMTVQFRVMPVGHLSAVRVTDNTTSSDALADCAVRSVRTIRLRAGPSVPFEAAYPLVFSNNP